MLRDAYVHDLNKGETLIEATRAHWRMAIFPMVYTVLFLVPASWILFTMRENYWGRVLLAMVVMVGLAAWTASAVLPFFHWATRSYAVTTTRVMFRDRLTEESSVELTKVNPPALHRTLFDVIFRSGTLDLGNGFVMVRIPRARKTQKVINELVASKPEDQVDLLKKLRAMGYKV